MDEDGHLAQVYVSEGVRPCRYRLQFAKDCFYGASSPKIPDITMLRSGHRICYTVRSSGGRGQAHEMAGGVGLQPTVGLQPATLGSRSV